ncbi:MULTISPECIES: hypothetical protein [unclassified Caballeronia]|jgi:hypothetical protein|uniref:hypothetical protein n=1 Tax=unclassified Caballeronia TaxID=2646786 RepID=UPI0013E9D372|nr:MULTISPECIES: hypothetical protein [unclassified Caballeronia]
MTMARLQIWCDIRRQALLHGHVHDTNNSFGFRFAHCLLEADDTFLRVPYLRRVDRKVDALLFVVNLFLV